MAELAPGTLAAADVVIIDDDSDMADTLSAFLQGEGHTVRVAYDGVRGLQVIRSQLPDLVLLDVEMPASTGPDMAQAMQAQDRGMERIPVVLCSGILNLDKVAAAVGTPYFLSKPFTLDAAIALIGKALRERRAPTTRSTRSGP